MRLKALFCVGCLLSALLCGCSRQEDVQVAATTLPVYQFTSALCEGTGIGVTRLITQQVSCLHDYSLNVSQVRSLELAEVVVISGGGLEEFMEDSLEKAQYVIDSSQGIPLLECEEHHHGEENKHHHHDQDAHIWLSPANAAMMAENIAQGLVHIYPDHQEQIQDNLIQLQQELAALEAYGQQQLSELSCREMITFHDGFGYLADAFELDILKAIEEESGSEASARELKEMITTVRQHQLPAIFTEVNGSVSAADIIGAETGVRVLALDMAMSEGDYFAAMYHNIDTIREAMG